MKLISLRTSLKYLQTLPKPTLRVMQLKRNSNFIGKLVLLKYD